MNGTGAYNQATDTASSLAALGFKTGTIGDVTPVGQEAETVVYYSSKSPASLATAQVVANSLSGAVIMADDASQVSPGSQVTVVTGTDFSVNPPAAAPTPTSAGGVPRRGRGRGRPRVDSGSSGNTGNSGAFAAPTATVEPLAPWDPAARVRRAGARAPEPEPAG